MRVSKECGPIHCANSTGSVWARNSCSGVALKSRVVRMIGNFGSASMVVSAMLLMARLPFARRGEHGVEAAVALLCLAPVALDPVVHQVEDLSLQVHRPWLRPSRPAHQ